MKKNNFKTVNKNLEVIVLKDGAKIKELYQKEAMVIEGLDMDSVNEYMDYLKEITLVRRERLYVISGKLMNSVYRLADENMYPDNIHIVCILPNEVLIDRYAAKELTNLGAKDLKAIVEDYKRMEIRRRAKIGNEYSAKDIVLNNLKRDRSLRYYIETKPGLSVSPLGISLLQTGEAKTADEDIEKIYVEDKEMLDRLYKEWALTIEGMSSCLLPLYMDFLETRTKVYRKRVYIIMGSTMNKIYGLTGRNAYKDDFPLVSISREDVNQDEVGIDVDRSVVGARFFNDIVDNNLRIERGNTKEENLRYAKLLLNAKGIIDPTI